MAHRVSSLLVIALFLVFSTSSIAFNITKILDQFPDTYGNFNELLSQTNLAQQINSRQTITVLALDNGSIDTLSGRPIDMVKSILSNHIILDYYDDQKLKNLKSKTTLVTTLYQTSGSASNNQGFLNATVTSSGDIMFGSGVKGAPLNSKLVGDVFAQPYNISVLHISEAIIAPGIDAPPQGPAPSPKNNNNNNNNTNATAAPTGSPTSSKAPKASPPGPPPTATANAPDAADSPASDNKPAAAPKSSASSMLAVGSGFGVALVMGFILNLMAL